MTFNGEKLKEARVVSGFHTQADFAKAVGVSQNSISKWESNLAEPDPKYIEKICKVLKIDRTAIFDREENIGDIRKVVREEIRSAISECELKGRAIPDDVAEMLSRCDDSIWDAIRALLKPYLRLRDRNQRPSEK